MDTYAFSGSHFEKSKMAAMRISVQNIGFLTAYAI